MDSVFLVKGHGMVARWESMAHLHSAIRALHAIVEEMKYDIKAMSAKTVSYTHLRAHET